MARKELLLLMVGASTVNYIGRAAISVAGPDIAKQYGFSEAQLGQIFSAFWLGYGLMMWPSGWMADRFGAGRMLGICGLLTAAALAGNTALSALAGFLAFRFLFGVASAVLYPACGSLTMRHYKNDQVAGVQGLVISGGNIGSAIAPFWVLWMSHNWGWRGAFLGVAGVTIGFFALWLARVPVAPVVRKQTQERLWLRRPILLLSLQCFCVGYFYSFGDTWSFYYFREVRHFPEEQSALFATLLQVAGGIMMPLGGWISDWWAPSFGRMRPAFGALFAAAVLLAASTWVDSPVGVLSFIAIAYGLAVACEGAFWWAVLTSSTENPGASFGFANAVGSGAQFLAPLLLPWIAGRWGWNSAVVSVAIVIAVAAILWRAAIQELS